MQLQFSRSKFGESTGNQRSPFSHIFPRIFQLTFRGLGNLQKNDRFESAFCDHYYRRDSYPFFFKYIDPV